MSRRNYPILFLLSINILFLSACNIHFSDVKKNSNILQRWNTHQQTLSLINHYQIRGSFAYISCNQKIYAYFNWQQIKPNNYRIILTDWFGITKIDLYVNSGIIIFINKQRQYYYSDNPGIVIKKIAGISIPLNHLQQWLLGLPGNGANFTLNYHGYLRTINYIYNKQKWIVIYKKYYSSKTISLPLSLELSCGSNNIKFKIDNWSI